jgi:hypothetical protein
VAKKGRKHRFFSRAKKMGRRISRKPLNMKSLAIGALVYGAGRAKLSSMLTPITSRIPMLGNVSDEVVLAGAAWFIGNKFKQPLIRDISRAAFTVEVARIGEAIATGQLGIGGASTTTSGSRMLF